MKDLLSRVSKLKEKSVSIIGTVAIGVGEGSTQMCGTWGFYEPEMPESLYMNNEE